MRRLRQQYLGSIFSDYDYTEGFSMTYVLEDTDYAEQLSLNIQQLNGRPLQLSNWGNKSSGYTFSGDKDILYLHPMITLRDSTSIADYCTQLLGANEYKQLSASPDLSQIMIQYEIPYTITTLFKFLHHLDAKIVAIGNDPIEKEYISNMRSEEEYFSATGQSNFIGKSKSKSKSKNTANNAKVQAGVKQVDLINVFGEVEDNRSVTEYGQNSDYSTASDLATDGVQESDKEEKVLSPWQKEILEHEEILVDFTDLYVGNMSGQIWYSFEFNGHKVTRALTNASVIPSKSCHFRVKIPTKNIEELYASNNLSKDMIKDEYNDGWYTYVTIALEYFFDFRTNIDKRVLLRYAMMNYEEYVKTQTLLEALYSNLYIRACKYDSDEEVMYTKSFDFVEQQINQKREEASQAIDDKFIYESMHKAKEKLLMFGLNVDPKVASFLVLNNLPDDEFDSFATDIRVSKSDSRATYNVNLFNAIGRSILEAKPDQIIQFIKYAKKLQARLYEQRLNVWQARKFMEYHADSQWFAQQRFATPFGIIQLDNIYTNQYLL